jgi:hypothetical protein
MSFTTDELESFNTILEQRLTAHDKELERIFDQRIQFLRQEFERSIASMQQGIIDALTVKLSEHQPETTQEFSENGQLPDAIEIQTDLPWEELNSLIGSALDERFAILDEKTQVALKNWEHMLSAQLQDLQMLQKQHHQTFAASAGNTVAELYSIEQLERLVESLQVTMTTNYALLSNRLKHHQQLSSDQAHPGSEENHAEILQIGEARPNGAGGRSSTSGEHSEQ